MVFETIDRYNEKPLEPTLLTPEETLYITGRISNVALNNLVIRDKKRDKRSPQQAPKQIDDKDKTVFELESIVTSMRMKRR